MLDAASDGTSIRITVFKLQPKRDGGNPIEVQLFTAQREDLEEGLWDRLRDGYGSGTYRVRVRRRVPGQRETIARQIDRTVMMRPGMPEPGALPLPQGSAAQAPAATPPGDIGALISTALTSALDRQAQMFTQVLDRALPRQQGGSMKEIVETLAALDQLRGNKEPAPAQNPMEFVKMGMELVRDAAPGEKGLADIATSFLQSPIMDKVADIFAQRGAQPAATAAAPQGPTTVAPRAIPQPQQPPPPAAQAYLLELIEQVAAFAEQSPQPDIADVADFVDDNAPPAMVRALAFDDALFEQVALHPLVMKHRGFFVALRADLAAGMIPPEGADANNDTSEPPPGPGGHQGDAKADPAANPGGQAS